METSCAAAPPIPVIVHQHAEESAMLRHIRSVLLRAPHVRLRHLRRLDDRIAAHLDGLAVAGRYGTRVCQAALERVGAGEVFAVAVRAIDEADEAALRRLLALAAALPDARRGLLSAFGWVSAQDLQGIVGRLLASQDVQARALGLDACRLHRVDPGPLLAEALHDAALRPAALRCAAELGRSDLLARIGVPDTAEAALAACLLGDRGEALQALRTVDSDAALQLLILATDFAEADRLLRPLAADRRRAIRACGWLGDTRFVPWLIEQMAEPALTRVAGEAFTLISGADLAALDLERKPSADARMGSSEDADEDDVALDEDESLPWPEPALVAAWWQRHAALMPTNGRCFMGATPTPGHCRAVLREGTQRQRFVAARWLCLLTPGTPLFPVCAPAWRQQRRLEAMT